jgi:hypothetical protein
MAKVDFKKEFKHLYNPTAKTFSVVDVPPMNFLMIDGKGNPNTSEAYKQAIDALFAVSYTLKFMVKKGEAQVDYPVMPLEGLWWAPDNSAFITGDKDSWQWTALMMQPEVITPVMVDEALREVQWKKNPPALGKVRFECFHEGSAVEIMYIGRFDAEGPTIAKMHQFIEDSGWQLSGKHHEIYLSDFRRTAPEKLKTVIRQPFRKDKESRHTY